ncbi:hypothetical protein ACFYT3_33195 [Nocardia amikacinitolerans]|uniref:hypothetical protein n=1 Tax=Nocardia amikacinitolerans TaxID=756689 RepID=UPI003691A03F
MATLGILFALASTQDRVPLSLVLLTVAAGAVGWAWAFDRIDRVFWTQIAGTLVFVTIAVAAKHADPTAARYLVAAGWIGHGLWDFAHHRANRAVARSFAEFCAVVDVLIGAAVLLVPWVGGGNCRRTGHAPRRSTALGGGEFRSFATLSRRHGCRAVAERHLAISQLIRGLQSFARAPASSSNRPSCVVVRFTYRDVSAFRSKNAVTRASHSA